MARSTFYYNTKAKPDKWAVERQRIVELYHSNRGRYGYRRLTLAMQNEGYVINGKTVRRLMAETGIKCQVRMKKFKSYRGEVGKIAPNLLERNFHADAPYRKLVTDVTEFHLFGTKIYLSPVLDLYNSEVVYYTIYRRPIMDMVKDMVLGTIAVIGSKTGAILHSDQGFHYQHKSGCCGVCQLFAGKVSPAQLVCNGLCFWAAGPFSGKIGLYQWPFEGTER